MSSEFDDGVEFEELKDEAAQEFYSLISQCKDDIQTALVLSLFFEEVPPRVANAARNCFMTHSDVKDNGKYYVSSDDLYNISINSVRDFIDRYSSDTHDSEKVTFNHLIQTLTIIVNAVKNGNTSLGLEKPGGPLDQVAFGTSRDDAPQEDNNDVERKLLKTLKRHFLDNAPINSADALLMRRIIRKGQYSDVFHKPTVDYVYRGIAVSLEWFKGMMKDENIATSGDKDVNFVLKPKGAAHDKFKKASSSWTASLDIASQFAGDESDPEDKPVVLVLTATTGDRNDNVFIECDDGLYKVKDLVEHESEHEILALGNVYVSHIDWDTRLPESDDDDE